MAVPFDRDRFGLPDRWRALRQPTRPATTALLGLVAASMLLAACGTEGHDPLTSVSAISVTPEPTQDGSSKTDTPTTDTPATNPPATDTAAGGLPAFPENTGPQVRRDSKGTPIVFSDVRVAEHEGFDRIVLEFSGTGKPGWAISYVDEAVLDGSGEVVTLAGDATLDIYASNTTAPAPGYYSGPARLVAAAGGITEVYVVGTFEGGTQVLAGVDGPRAMFRVFALTHPSRMVVDVESID